MTAALQPVITKPLYSSLIQIASIKTFRFAYALVIAKNFVPLLFLFLAAPMVVAKQMKLNLPIWTGVPKPGGST